MMLLSSDYQPLDQVDYQQPVLLQVQVLPLVGELVLEVVVVVGVAEAVRLV